MATNNSPKTVLDLTRVQAALENPAYRQRFEQSMRDVKSLQEKAVVNRARLHTPVSF
jgi:hypothetical protein